MKVIFSFLQKNKTKTAFLKTLTSLTRMIHYGKKGEFIIGRIISIKRCDKSILKFKIVIMIFFLFS